MAKKIFLTVIMTFLFCPSFVSTLEAQVVQNAKKKNYVLPDRHEYWHKVMNAIIFVESKGNTKAVSKSKKYVGAMQISKIVVDDCNEYLKIKGDKKRYTYSDRYDLAKSKEMFILIQERYNPKSDIESAIRIWNGGCYYSKSKTDKYYRNVISYM